MAISGSYDSVIRGVSEQVPQDRFEGQHFEQLNMISDTVRGLCRRQGSRFQSEKDFAVFNALYKEATLEDTKDFRSIDLTVGPDRFAIFYRQKAKTLNSQAPFCFCVNKDTRQVLPVVLGADVLTNTLVSGGASAAVNIGRYIFFAGNNIVPDYTANNTYTSKANEELGITWVRLGAYSRKFEMKFTIYNSVSLVSHTITVPYTTMGSSYPLPLDTSDLLSSDPDYQKKVNDRVNAYNGEVTKHIGLAGADVVATNIAKKLWDKVELARLALPDPAAFVATLSGSTIGINCDGNWRITKMSSSDNGDQTLMRTVFDRVSDPAQLSAEHYVGKVVKISPKKTNGSDGYYVKANPRQAGETGLTEVEWGETTAEIITPTNVLVYATVEAGTLYIAGSAAGLELLAASIDTDFINYKNRTVGDSISAPIPNFFGKVITYLGSFQDRLVIAAGGTLSFSRTGDYLNFFRESVLTIADDDPVETYATGSEDDNIVSSTYYDKNLVLFGKRKQYAINGRAVLTPQAPLVTILSQNEDATDAIPMGSGNFVIYGKYRKGYSSLHQLQMGQAADSPESYENSLQLSRYLVGRPVEILPVTSPNTIFFRTSGYRNGFYVYNYLDSSNGEGRKFDAWSRWEWNVKVGSITGMTWDNGDLLVGMIRHGNDRFGTDQWFFALESFATDTDLSSDPYLDSLRTFNEVEGSTPVKSWMHSLADDKTLYQIAFNDTVPEFLLGQTYANKLNLTTTYPTILGAARVGIPFDAHVVPTNPYFRDEQGKAIVSGILSILRYSVSLSETAGLRAFINHRNLGWKRIAKDWTGREIGRLSATLGIQPIASGTVTVPIGSSDFKYKLSAVNWLPLTITAIEWTGQFFYRKQRA